MRNSHPAGPMLADSRYEDPPHAPATLRTPLCGNPAPMTAACSHTGQAVELFLSMLDELRGASANKSAK